MAPHCKRSGDCSDTGTHLPRRNILHALFPCRRYPQPLQAGRGLFRHRDPPGPVECPPCPFPLQMLSTTPCTRLPFTNGAGRPPTDTPTLSLPPSLPDTQPPALTSSRPPPPTPPPCSSPYNGTWMRCQWCGLMVAGR